VSILQNAIDSIQIGIEDYENGDDRRNVSAVRNVAAGTLLLYKEKLCRLSPPYATELLIRQDIRPTQDQNGTVIFEGKGKKTVDVQTIKERFKSLKVAVDWKRFDEVNALRNDLEHYYTSKSPDAIREIIAKSFLLIRDFIVNELDENPRDLLGEDCWSSLLTVNEVYSAEESDCKASICKVDWRYDSVRESLDYLRCPECHSSLINAVDSTEVYPNINLHCNSCNYQFTFDEVVERCIDENLSGEAHISIKDGGESPYAECPECDRWTFIFSEDCCVACGYEMEYQNCEICEEPLTLEEQWNDGTCSYCQHKWAKIMEE
jgi:hypothetical protein